MRWVGAMKNWHRQFLQFSAREDELLLVQGTADMTVAWRYNTRLILRKLPRAQLVYVPAAGHQLVNEIPAVRAQVFDAIQRHFFNL